MGFPAKNYRPKTRLTIPSRHLDSIGCAQSSPDMLSKWPKTLSMSFYRSLNFFYLTEFLLTNWCLQTSITLKLRAWFFYSLTWLARAFLCTARSRMYASRSYLCIALFPFLRAFLRLHTLRSHHRNTPYIDINWRICMWNIRIHVDLFRVECQVES